MLRRAALIRTDLVSAGIATPDSAGAFITGTAVLLQGSTLLLAP